MSADKHTPGPLEVYVGGNFVCLGRPGYVANSAREGHHGASVGELASAALRHGYEKSEFAEAVANMRLYAAAPDLLAACEACLEPLPYDPDTAQWSEPGDEELRSKFRAEWLRRDTLLRAAVAKARGADKTS